MRTFIVAACPCPCACGFFVFCLQLIIAPSFGCTTSTFCVVNRRCSSFYFITVIKKVVRNRCSSAWNQYEFCSFFKRIFDQTIACTIFFGCGLKSVKEQYIYYIYTVYGVDNQRTSTIFQLSTKWLVIMSQITPSCLFFSSFFLLLWIDTWHKLLDTFPSSPSHALVKVVSWIRSTKIYHTEHVEKLKSNVYMFVWRQMIFFSFSASLKSTVQICMTTCKLQYFIAHKQNLIKKNA